MTTDNPYFYEQLYTKCIGCEVALKDKKQNGKGKKSYFIISNQAWCYYCANPFVQRPANYPKKIQQNPQIRKVLSEVPHNNSEPPSFLILKEKSEAIPLIPLTAPNTPPQNIRVGRKKSRSLDKSMQDALELGRFDDKLNESNSLRTGKKSNKIKPSNSFLKGLFRL